MGLSLAEAYVECLSGESPRPGEGGHGNQPLGEGFAGLFHALSQGHPFHLPRSRKFFRSVSPFPSSR